MSKVMATTFRDGDGRERCITTMTETERIRFHLRKGRQISGATLYCVHCETPVHPVHLRTGLWFVRHAPGSGLERCEYAYHYQRCSPRMSPEHKQGAATICITINRLANWTADVEANLTDHATGRRIRADVLAKPHLLRLEHHIPTVHEIQLSPQAFNETVIRTQERERTDAGRTIWWTPNPDTISDETTNRHVRGLITDPACIHIAARAYSEIPDPILGLDPIPMEPSVSQAAAGLARDTNRWVLSGPSPDEGWILVPQAYGSARQSDRRRQRHEVSAIDEYGCTRPIYRPTARSSTRGRTIIGEQSTQPNWTDGDPLPRLFRTRHNVTYRIIERSADHITVQRVQDGKSFGHYIKVSPSYAERYWEAVK